MIEDSYILNEERWQLKERMEIEREEIEIRKKKKKEIKIDRKILKKKEKE